MSQDEPAVNDEVVQQDATGTESAPVEDQAPEVVESSQEQAEPTEESPEDTTPEVTESEAEDTEDDAEPRGKADERKQQLNTEIRDLVAQRNTLRQEVERMNAQVYRPVTEQELLDQINPETGEYYNRTEAKVAALEQQIELQRYNEQVSEAQIGLRHEALKALQDFPMFDAESPEYNPEVASQVDQLLSKNLVFDPNTGQVIGSHVSPYQLYKTVALSAQAGATTGQLKAQKATEKMLASADTPPSAQQGNVPYEKLSLEEKAAYLRKKGYDI